MSGTITGVEAVVSVGGQSEVYGSWIMNGGRLITSDNLYVSSYGMLTLYGSELTVIGECSNGTEVQQITVNS